MSKDFFRKPFTEDTNIKLELYREYLLEWFPVFVAAHKPFKYKVNLFDFFSGTGTDSIGTLGSPLIALDVLNSFEEYVKKTNVEINLIFNDIDKNHLSQLKQNINDFGFNQDKINIDYFNEDFVELFPKLTYRMQDAANLLFLDQFGIKYIDKHVFTTLTTLKTTDILFFISSSTFNRFPDDPNVTHAIGLSSKEIKARPFYEIHRLVHQRYSELIPDKHAYYLAPFSIKKGKNIYGLIFGSPHPLGLEKFLDICWKKDATTGEANFDIQGDRKAKREPSLFDKLEGYKKPTKIESFQNNLKELILEGKLKSDLDIFLYMINNGFIAKHVIPVIKELKKNKQIEIKSPSFRCSTVWKSTREPKKISILR